MNPTPEPQLAPPGAGLPAIEHLIARLLFGLCRRTGNRRSFTAKFQLERERIRLLLRSLDAQSGACRILIARPPGLEDSSRYWSVWMTLDHLRIVHHEFVRIIEALIQGFLPEGTASTAAVKPSLDATTDVVTAYEESCDILLAAVAAAPDLQTAKRYVHPWFGPLNAAGWYALAGEHLGIHRVQVERILRGLAARRP